MDPTGSTPAHIIHRPAGSATPAQQLGPYLIQTLIHPHEEKNLTAYHVTIQPHQQTQTSHHRIAEELYYIITGHGTALLDGKPHHLNPGDLLRLPPGTTHAFITHHEPLHMLNIHTPGCRPDHDVYFADGPAPDGFRPG